MATVESVRGPVELSDLGQVLITVYWGKRGLDSCLPERITGPLQLEHLPHWQPLAMILAHAVVAMVGALVLLHLQHRRRGAR